MYTLLLADDEPLIRRGISSMTALSDIGIGRVFEAEDALSALSVTDTENIDIVFLDINMPDMDGLTLAAKIRSAHPKVRIVMITGYDYFDYMQTAIRVGVDDYLLKPVSRADIEQVLKRVIQKLRALNVSQTLQTLSTPAADNPEPDAGEISDYIRAHLFDPALSLGRAAEALGFNSSYFSSIFKKRYGVPFQEYVGLRRMEQAKRLLLSRDLTNAEIAHEIGYEDVNYFITKFKKTYQLSPKQFRQGVLKNEI